MGSDTPSIETLMWVLGALFVPAIGWGIVVWFQILNLRRDMRDIIAANQKDHSDISHMMRTQEDRTNTQIKLAGKTLDVANRLLDMHNHPERTGFGIAPLEPVLKEILEQGRETKQVYTLLVTAINGLTAATKNKEIR